MRILRLRLFSSNNPKENKTATATNAPETKPKSSSEEKPRWKEEEIKLYKKADNRSTVAAKALALGTGIGVGTYFAAPHLGKELGMTNALPKLTEIAQQSKIEEITRLQDKAREIKNELSQTERNVRAPFQQNLRDLEDKKAKSDSAVQEINKAEEEALQRHKEHWDSQRKEKLKKKGITDKDKVREFLEITKEREETGRGKIKDKFEERRKGTEGYISDHGYQGTKEELARREAAEVEKTVGALKKRRDTEFGNFKSTLKEEIKNKSAAAGREAAKKEVKAATRKMKVLGYGTAGVAAASYYLNNRRERKRVL